MATDPPAPFHPAATRRPRKNEDDDDASFLLSAAAAGAVVRVGVGVVVVNPRTGRVYAGVRRGSHGAGRLALPGGHLELFETWEECARREVREEMGIELHDPRRLPPSSLPGVEWGHATNDVMRPENKHYVTIFMLGTLADGGDREPRNLEPGKCEGWREYSWGDLVRLAEEQRGRDEPDDGAGEGGPLRRRGADGRPELFGPLLQLVRDSPERVLDYLRRAGSSRAGS